VSVLLVADAVLASGATVAAPSVAGRSPRTPAERGTLIAVVVAALAIVVVPLWRLLRGALTGPDGFTIANFTHIGEGRQGSVFSIDAGSAIWTSVHTAAIACVLAMVIGGLVATVVGLGARSRGVWALVAVPLGVSAVTLGFGYVVAFDRWPLDLRGSPWLVPLAQALVAMPFVVRILAPAIAAAHVTYGESAAALGASPWRAFRDATLPVSAGAIRTATTFAFLIALGEFGATAFVVRADTPTVPVAIARLLDQPGASSLGQASALAVILLALTASASLVIGALRFSGWTRSTRPVRGVII
jgi:thiamine transport system permease protein